MFIVHRQGHREDDLAVAAPGATVGEVADALHHWQHQRSGAGEATRHEHTLRVDGAVLDRRRSFESAGMACGAVVEVVPVEPHLRAAAPRHVDGSDAAWTLSVTGGLWSGSRRLAGDAGVVVVGREPGDSTGFTIPDPTVSARHLRVACHPDHVVVEDLASRNGTFLDGHPLAGPREVTGRAVLHLGASTLEIAPAGATHRRSVTGGSRSGPWPLHRPPRTPPHPPAATIPLPEAPSSLPARSPVGVAAVALPIVFGLALMWLLHSLLWGLFSLLGPAVLLATSWEQRHRGRRGARRASARYRRELARLDAALGAAALAEHHALDLATPGIATLVGWLAAHDRRLWETRSGHPDFLRLRLGDGPVEWHAPLSRPPSDQDAALATVLGKHAVLPDAAVALALGGGAVLGLHGDGRAARAIARSLVIQAAIRHGPADLRIAVLTDDRRAGSWHWALRLPHTRRSDTGAALLAAGDAAEALTEELHAEPLPALLVILDAPDLLARRRSRIRSLLTAPEVSAVVLAGAREPLPAACTVVAAVDADGVVAVDDPDAPATGFRGMGTSTATAAEAARLVAAWEDPERDGGTSVLPVKVHLASLLPFDAIDPASIASAWARPDGGLAVPIGAGADGPLVVDLAVDGPHALVAGTTGSGKSELLRTLVTALATTHSPSSVELVLIDFKGGSTFQALQGLPHVVGAATDLDGDLARRAVLALEAELRRRELLLREAGADDLAGYLRASHRAEPLPRLVVLIDEFATLAADHPAVLEGFVSVAQRGRSLGLHLVLATQRPSGSVNANVRANTNLRIALRVQNSADSSDVIDVPDAATLPRRVPGRALARLGPSELILLQTATTSGRGDATVDGVELWPLGEPRRDEGTGVPGDGGGWLDQVVAAVDEAHRLQHGASPRALWPPPLLQQVPLTSLWQGKAEGTELSTRGDAAVRPPVAPFALGDDPAGQRQLLVAWDAEAHLLVTGSPGSGASTTLTAACLSLARTWDPGELHLYALAAGDGLAALAALPHTGAVIRAREAERQQRLGRHLAAELDQRLTDPGGTRPRIVVAVDGVAALLAAHDDPFDPLRVTLERLLREGPAVGIAMALSVERPGGLPAAWASLIRQRLVLRLTEPAELAVAGVPRGVTIPAVPGRGWWIDGAVAVQVGDPSDAVVDAAQRCGPRPAAIGVLPARVRGEQLAACATQAAATGGRLHLPVGIAETDLAPAVLTLHPGEHALVVGPPRSGRSSLLAGVASALLQRGAGITTVVVEGSGADGGGRGGAVTWPRGCQVLDRRGWVERVGEVTVAGADGPVLVLIDDAHRVEPDEPILRLLAAAPPNVHVVASTANTGLRAGFGHWTRRLAESRAAVLLAPDVDLDGELFGVRLPRRPPAKPGVGRGWLVADGLVTYLQAVS